MIAPITSRTWLVGALLIAACGGSSSEPPATPAAAPLGGPPVVPAPAGQGTIPEGAPIADRPAIEQTGSPCEVELTLAPPGRAVPSPLAAPLTPAQAHAREALVAVVQTWGRDPANPWAVSHAMLALGPDLELTNGRPAIDWLFSEYAEVQTVAGEEGLAFPARRGAIRIEPHTDLLLKAITEQGVAVDRVVLAGGAPRPISALYRRSLCAAWVDGASLSAGSWNDTPWALQGLAQWAPPGLGWTADGGHGMTMDLFTDAVARKLVEETAFLSEARAAGRTVQKQKQGIFAYTCGGAHLIQGVAWAVGRGFGAPENRALVADQVSLYLWRVDAELAQVDTLIAQNPEYAVLLLDQRLKVLGHALETAHKAAAMGLYTPDDADRARLAKVLDELVATVAELEKKQVLERLEQVRASNEQTFLDFVGDAAHAVRGLDLAAGAGVVRY